MKKKKPQLSFVEKLHRLKAAGLKTRISPEPEAAEIGELESLGERIEKILDLVRQFDTKSLNMIFFVMYDIENTRVRTQIAKYLIRNGCVRIQKSVYLAQLDAMKYNEIHQTLKEVQDVYDNNDSIVFVPVSSDEITAMKIVGEKIVFNLILENKNTLFF
jgi:CRISPR-associated protein Cas2